MTENYMTKGLPIRQVFCFAGPGTQGNCGYNSRKPALTAAKIILYAPVISPLSFSAEIACGKLTHTPVIMKTIAAHSLAAARVGAVAYLFVLLNLAIHF